MFKVEKRQTTWAVIGPNEDPSPHYSGEWLTWCVCDGEIEAETIANALNGAPRWHRTGGSSKATATIPQSKLIGNTAKFANTL